MKTEMKNAIKIMAEFKRRVSARADLNRQLGGLVDGVITGYAQKYHLSEVNAEKKVRLALLKIVDQIEQKGEK